MSWVKAPPVKVGPAREVGPGLFANPMLRTEGFYCHGVGTTAPTNKLPGRLGRLIRPLYPALRVRQAGRFVQVSGPGARALYDLLVQLGVERLTRMLRCHKVAT